MQDGAFRKGTKKSRSRFPVGLVKRRQGIGFFFSNTMSFNLFLSFSLRTENYRLGTLPNISPPPLQHETPLAVGKFNPHRCETLKEGEKHRTQETFAHLSLKPATST